MTSISKPKRRRVSDRVRKTLAVAAARDALDRAVLELDQQGEPDIADELRLLRDRCIKFEEWRRTT